ncbi:hypothetical protein [Verrucosispora sp. NA02020]|uniref:hypothetical protein n=1 Tax=Verrucosispora sp. NA02020 TaxID=2742132 RepID=UPI00159064D5|nr:hypothetical protein [Verrucosispora sp. NA02020]QKW15459.1 hypothetical protein HUT12_23605 [Verrucosispora sp. NA02020]
MTAAQPTPQPMDLRHLALILDAGKHAAEQMGDAALCHTLGSMAEVATQLHLNPDGTLFNVERDFAVLADRLT